MASDAAAPRDDELAGYSAEELVALLRTTRLSSDFDAVARVLRARERRAAQVEAELEARDKQAAEFSDSIAMIVEEVLAKLKASFYKFHGPLKKAGHDAVPSGQETPDCMALTLVTTSSIPVAEQSKGKQPVMEMVKVSEGARADADADGSVGKSLKRKADAVENRGGVSPVQISGELQERTVATGTSPPPGFSPITQFISSSSIYQEEGGPSSYSSLSQAIMVSSEVSKEMSSIGGSCKTLTIKEPNNILEKKTGEEHTQNQGGHQEPTYLGGASSIMSLITVPVQQVERLDTATVSKRGRGRGRTGPKRKEKNNNVSRGSPLPCSGPGPGRGRGRGRGRSNTSANPALGGGLNLPAASPLVAHTSAPAALGALTIDDLTSPRPVADTLAKRLLQSVVAARGILNRPSPLVKAPRPQTAQKYPASLENGSETRNDGQVKMNNITILGTGHLLLPRPSPFIINTASRAEIHSIPGMGGKVTENLGICVENKADSVPVMDNGDEEGDVGIYSNDIGGTSPRY